VLVGGLVVGDGVDQLARGYSALDRVEEADELLMVVLGHAMAQHDAILDIQCGERGGDAIAFVRWSASLAIAASGLNSIGGWA
jgi:hypothetical protein